jgi:predicted transcriptional regulator YdeE
VSDQNPPAPAIVERPAVAVMFLRCADDIAIFRPLWARFEAQVGLRGRKFYGAFYPEPNEYHVCAGIKNGDDPASQGFEVGSLPAGRYLRAQLRGEPPEVYDGIGRTFESLQKLVAPDVTRPFIEFYRRHDEIDLFLPVAQPHAVTTRRPARS